MGAEVLKEAQREEKAMGEKLAGGRLREPYCYRVRYRDAGHDCQAEISVIKSQGYGYDLRPVSYTHLDRTLRASR